MEKMLTIYQTPKKGKITPKIRARERYHVYRALDKIPTRYVKYSQMTDEEKDNLKQQVTRSRMKNYHKDPVYKAKVNKERTIASLRQRQRERGDTKYCHKCETHRPFADYDTKGGNGNDKDKLRYDCRKCRKKRNAEAYQRRIA